MVRMPHGDTPLLTSVWSGCPVHVADVGWVAWTAIWADSGVIETEVADGAVGLGPMQRHS
jgi:hypothetical protein